jgi:Pectate lyase superfamily protein
MTQIGLLSWLKSTPKFPHLCRSVLQDRFGAMIMVTSKGERRATVILSSALLLGANCISFEATAQSRGVECATAPAASLVVSVKDKGATGDGRTDDTAAIQAAVDEIGGTGGTVLVPNGTYMVDAVGKKRLALKSGMTLKLSEGATLKAIANSSKKYAVLSISGASDVRVVGGTLEGERNEHIGEAGDGGMGIRIDHGSEHIEISGVTAKEMWGDGFYVQGAADVKFCSVTADHNRRQGLSIIEADGLAVTNSVFKNTQGTRPSAGIDLEPDKAVQKITSVRIQNSKFLDNAGGGIQIAGKKGQISKVEIMHNVFSRDRPLLVENAPFVGASAICDNRQITSQLAPSGGLDAFAEPIELVVHQNDCQDGRDPRFEVNRQNRKSR